MAIKVLQARDRTSEFRYQVLLDHTREDVVLEAAVTEVKNDAGAVVVPAKAEVRGADPKFLREYAWGATPPTGQSRAQYLTAIRRDLKALAQLDLAKVAPAAGTALPDEGATL